MTDTELSALESLAKAATPGPWEYDVEQGEYHGVWADGCYIVPSLHIDADNCKYIAAVNPTVVLELIEELRREREKFKLATIRYHEECVVRDWLAMHFGKLEKCKTCRELPDDIVTVQDCIQCVVEYARKNVGGEDD